jgi:hypothetical protein
MQYGVLRRIAKKYGDAINITIVDPTAGYVRDSPPLSPAQEADELAQFYHELIGVPVTVGVDTSMVKRLPPPSNERVVGKAPFEKSPYYQFGAIMTDQSGTILFMLPFDLPPESMLDALLEHEIGH